jgi:hypothetical protein
VRFDVFTTVFLKIPILSSSSGHQKLDLEDEYDTSQDQELP